MQHCEPSASQWQQLQSKLHPQPQPQPQPQPGLRWELTTRGTLEVQCFHFYDAGFVYERETPKLVCLVTAINEKLLHVLENKVSGIIQFNPHKEWREIMELITSYLHPDYQDRDACEVLVTLLVSVGTNIFLPEIKIWLVS